MKNLRNHAGLLLSGALLLAACDKNDTGALDGPVPMGTFTTTSRTVGLTTEVTFTAAPNPDAFLYHWEFGDGDSPNGLGSVATGQTVKHVYTKGGTFKAQLITSGRGGQGFSTPQDVVIPSSLNVVKQYLTNGSSRTWKLDNTVVAPITVGPSDADPTSYYAGNPAPGGLPACQADDEYTFSNTNVFTYDAKADLCGRRHRRLPGPAQREHALHLRRRHRRGRGPAYAGRRRARALHRRDGCAGLHLPHSVHHEHQHGAPGRQHGRRRGVRPEAGGEIALFFN
jgi:hypothetical protein